MRLLPSVITAASASLAVAASPALAQTSHSLALSGPSAATVGTPATLLATGTVADDPSVVFDRYVKVYAIPASVVSSCPATPVNAIDLSSAASAQGGKTVSSGAPVTGSFSVPIAFTPGAPGRVLLCAYLTEGFNSADATASHNMAVTGGGTSAAGAPKSLRAPTVRRSGRRLVCDRGRWSQKPSRYAYHWRIDGRRKAGAARRTLPITRALERRSVRCGVTATNRAGSATKLSRSLRV
jgi:hypothetical protein